MSALASHRAASGADADGGFAQTLATLTGDDDADDAPPLPLPAQRQDGADDGKTLPGAAADPAAPAMLDPRLLWLPAGLLPTTPPPLSAAAIVKPVPQPVVATMAAADPLSTLATPDTGATKPTATKTLDQIASGLALPAKLTDLFHAAERALAPPAADPAPAPAQPQPAASTTPAISTELAALGLDPTARDVRKKAADPILQPTTMTTEVALQNAVQPTADTRHVPLDLRGDTGLQKMIDHIETLRDGADANDTRIRLVPDALGAVDVSVRRDGDAVHVHFTAENAATRTLLTDAQPRLAELADARGVRISGSSVDAGTGGSAQQQPQPHRPAGPTTNLTPSTAIEATGDDARLA